MTDPKFITIFETEDYTVQLQYNELGVMLHIPRIKKFKPKEFKRKLEELCDFLGTMGYAVLFAKPKDPRFDKLCPYFGFEEEYINGVQVWAKSLPSFKS